MALHELYVEPQVSEVPRLNAWIETCLGAEEVGEDIAFKLTLSVEEAVMNVIDHAFVGRPPPHVIRLQLDISTERVVAEVIDNGHAFDPTTAPDPDVALPLEEREPGGLGVHLMRNMMDRLSYRYDGGNNILRLEKARG